ncbi:MAG TPA: hypothetical protein VFV75_13520 [Candidatus Polarisedimenticolaceae bacterium]|nr:hypothetical protein [Candidatus Polarisedimenticolaceae bacterium]
MAVLYFALMSVLLAYLRLGIHWLFGEAARIKWGYLLSFWVCALVAALCFGYVRRYRLSPAYRPWVLGLSASAGFWFSLLLLIAATGSRTVTWQDPGLAALASLIFGFLFGLILFLLPAASR